MLKALFVIKTFVLTFRFIEQRPYKNARLISKFMMPQTGQQIIILYPISQEVKAIRQRNLVS